MDVHGALLHEDAIAPHLVEQLRAAVDAFGMRHEEVQHAELDVAQLNFLPVAGDETRGGVEHDPGQLDGLVGELGLAAPDDRPDPRQQLAREERLGDVVVDSRLQTHDAVLLAHAAGQHDDRDARGARIGAQAPREQHARRLRQHPVQHHQAGELLPEHGIRFLDAARGQRAIPRALEVYDNEVPDFLLVLDYQDLSVHRFFSFSLSLLRPAPEALPTLRTDAEMLMKENATRSRARLVFAVAIRRIGVVNWLHSRRPPARAVARPRRRSAINVRWRTYKWAASNNTRPARACRWHSSCCRSATTARFRY